MSDVEKVTGLSPKSARNFIAKVVSRGLATRLKPGLFILVPFELGREREYLGNPYLVAREIAGGKEYYLSYASAMDLHGMVTQPRLIVYTSATKPIRPRIILGTEFRFVRCKPRHLFGLIDHWVDKTEKVRVSDLDRTVIDGLKHPEYCGGFSEVARGFWMRRDDFQPKLLVDYALQLGVGAVIRRLGFLLEVCEVQAPDEIARLRSELTATYHLLDPVLPPGGKFFSRWRLRLNVSPDEIRMLRSA
ncbi:MAG: transcriptional regulator [Deltaproteobacteria bacterium]|nr:transcriptional regulator [Deltaproteobacteria bacterium]